MWWAIIIVVVALAALVVGSIATYWALLAPRTIQLSSFSPVASPGDDCDSIRLNTLQSPSSGPGSTEIFLETLPRIDWKALELYIGGRKAGTIEAQDGSRAPERLIVAPHELSEAQLLFYKAKFLGIHTRMYQINGLEGLANQQATFVWERDRC